MSSTGSEPAGSLRVLRVSHSAPVAAWRGRERALRQLGHDVALISAKEWDEAGSPVVLAPGPDENVRGIRTWGRHPALFLYDPVPLWRALGKRIDVLDIHEEPYALATAEILLLRRWRRQRAPYTLYSAQNIAKRYPWPFSALERRALQSASGLSACNVEAARIMTAKGLAGRAAVIPLGVDLDTFRPDPDRTRRTGDEGVVVGYAGRLEERKGLLVLLDALRRDQRLRLRVAGSGPLEALLRGQAEAADLAGRVTLLGPLTGADLVDFYQSIDVLAVPSLDTPRWREQFGRVVVEAMACGTPVVSSDGGSLPDLVAGVGAVVPQGDAAALAAALVALGASGPARTAAVDAGLDCARGCSWEQVGAAYDRMYARMVREAPPPAAGARARVEIVVVAFGRPDLLQRALTPLTGRIVTVVDNSSSPEVAQVCRELGVRYLDPGRNGGFAAGVNIALRDRVAPGADVLLLNPDAVIDGPDIDVLHAHLRADPDLASVAPTQVGDDGSPVRVAWPFPSPLQSLLWGAGLARLAARPDYVIGSILLLRAEALQEVGELDENFFLYAEETDWARRAARLGWRHEVVTAVTARHTGAATSLDSDVRDVRFHRAQETYLRKHYGTLGWSVARVGTIAGAAARAIVLRGPRRHAAQRLARLYVAGPARVAARSGAVSEQTRQGGERS